MTTTIIGINLENRLETSIEFQKILTTFGCEIRTRIGLHPLSGEVCSNNGIILLEVSGNADALVGELSREWKVQTMIFD